MHPSTDLTCREFVEPVTNYLEGSLPLTERARFETHLADCDDCPFYLAQMRQTIRLTGALTEERIAPAAKDELLRRFRHWAHERAEPPGPLR